MKPNIQALLAKCIDEGLLSTMYAVDGVTHEQMSKIIDKASDEIWLQIDMYFTFTDDNN